MKSFVTFLIVAIALIFTGCSLSSAPRAPVTAPLHYGAPTSAPTAVPTADLSLDSPIPRYAGTDAGQATREMTNACLMGKAHCPVSISPSLGPSTKLVPTHYASLPGSPSAGMKAYVDDALMCVPGVVITSGGHSAPCEVVYNGTNWAPVGNSQPVFLTFATLPSSPPIGTTAMISDDITCDGAVVAEGNGGNPCQVVYIGLGFWLNAGGVTGSRYVATELQNDATTGTGQYLLEVATSNVSTLMTVKTAPAGTTSGIVGICNADCGLYAAQHHNESITGGSFLCTFDNTAVENDYYQASSSVAGNCHDAGGSLPGSGQVLGRVLTAGTGLQSVYFNNSGDVVTGGGGGGSPGGSTNAVQYKSGSSSFGGVSLGADTLLQGTASAPQALSIPDCPGGNLVYATASHTLVCPTTQTDTTSNTVAAGVARVFCNSSSGITESLLSGIAVGSGIDIKNLNTGTCTIDSGVGNLIDASEFYALSVQYQAVRIFKASSSQWWVL